MRRIPAGLVFNTVNNTHHCTAFIRCYLVVICTAVSSHWFHAVMLVVGLGLGLALRPIDGGLGLGGLGLGLGGLGLGLSILALALPGQGQGLSAWTVSPWHIISMWL